MAFLTARARSNFVASGGQTRRILPPGDSGSIQTAHEIKRLIKEGTADFKLRQFVLREMLRGVPEKNTIAEINAIHNWVRTHLIYRKDPVGIDLVIGAPKILDMILNGTSGFDCDDMVVFEGASLRIAGIPVDLVIIKGNPKQPNLYSHIYLVAYDPKTGKSITLDPIMKGPKFPPGWEASRYFHKEIIQLDGNMAGIGYYGFGSYNIQNSGFGQPASVPFKYQHPSIVSWLTSAGKNSKLSQLRNASYSGTPEQKWDQFIERRRQFFQYMNRIDEAINEDMMKVAPLSHLTETQKSIIIQDLSRKNQNYQKKFREDYMPLMPQGIPISLQIQTLENQNSKLRSFIDDINAIRKVSGVFDKVAEDYNNRIAEAEYRIQHKARKKQKLMLGRKFARDMGAVALSFIPIFGTVASVAGTAINELYANRMEQENYMKWLNKSIKAAELGVKASAAESYLLPKGEELRAQTDQLVDFLQAKIDLNNEVIKLLKQNSQPQNGNQIIKQEIQAASPQQNQKKTAAVVAGTGAAALLLWALI